MHDTAIAWFRNDLRLADNPGLVAAMKSARTVCPLYVYPSPSDPHGPGAAARAYRALSLDALDARLQERGNHLAVRPGPAAETIVRCARECGATLVTCTRDHTPDGRALERAVGEELARERIGFEVADEGQLLVPPRTLPSASGEAYRVFTPFWRAWRRAWRLREPDPAPHAIAAPPLRPLSAGSVSPAPGAPDVARWWTPGEDGARELLRAFDAGRIARYDAERDLPARPATSRLSPALACGELSPMQVAWEVVRSAGEEAAEPFLRQLAWREFAYHTLDAHPDSFEVPLRAEFSAMPWRDDPAALEAWAAGRTGWPLVDAGMRQLAVLGWMHNRVRLVAASVLVKDLLVPWQAGEEVFRQRLVDYDPAANAFNWQWVAGCGADAAPYFRIFNPTLQGTRFDADGAYVREWVPELAALPDRWIQRPHEAPARVLEEAGVVLGETYPRPLVDHAEARERALAAFKSLRR